MKKLQSGAYLVLVSLLLVALIGVGALALDLGRMFVVRSQIQNAADSAALAAAAELGGSSRARIRAEQVARGLLVHNSSFTNDENLLSEDRVSVEFYSELGDPPGSARVVASNDSEARFARVTISQATVQLFFLPVLGNTAATEGFLSAAATAGRSESPPICGVAPIMLCAADNISLPLGTGSFVAGNQVQMPFGGSHTSGAGNWGFILPASEGNANAGLPGLRDYLQNPTQDQYCLNPDSSITFDTIPGGRGNNPNLRDDLNDFFGITGGSDAYPRDSIATGGDNQTNFGSGDWTESDYTNVNGTPVSGIDHYASRLDAHIGRGNEAGARLFVMPVISDCDALGRDEVTLVDPDGFAQFFITEPVVNPAGSRGPELMAEFVGWGAGDDTSAGTSGGVTLYE